MNTTLPFAWSSAEGTPVRVEVQVQRGLPHVELDAPEVRPALRAERMRLVRAALEQAGSTWPTARTIRVALTPARGTQLPPALDLGFVAALLVALDEATPASVAPWLFVAGIAADYSGRLDGVGDLALHAEVARSLGLRGLVVATGDLAAAGRLNADDLVVHGADSVRDVVDFLAGRRTLPVAARSASSPTATPQLMPLRSVQIEHPAVGALGLAILPDGLAYLYRWNPAESQWSAAGTVPVAALGSHPALPPEVWAVVLDALPCVDLFLFDAGLEARLRAPAAERATATCPPAEVATLRRALQGVPWDALTPPISGRDGTCQMFADARDENALLELAARAVQTSLLAAGIVTQLYDLRGRGIPHHKVAGMTHAELRAIEPGVLFRKAMPDELHPLGKFYALGKTRGKHDALIPVVLAGRGTRGGRTAREVPLDLPSGGPDYRDANGHDTARVPTSKLYVRLLPSGETARESGPGHRSIHLAGGVHLLPSNLVKPAAPESTPLPRAPTPPKKRASRKAPAPTPAATPPIAPVAGAVPVLVNVGMGGRLGLVLTQPQPQVTVTGLGPLDRAAAVEVAAALAREAGREAGAALAVMPPRAPLEQPLTVHLGLIVAALAQEGLVPADAARSWGYVGSTSLSGRFAGDVTWCAGALPAVLAYAAAGVPRVIVGAPNGIECAALAGIDVRVARTVQEVAAFLRGETPLPPAEDLGNDPPTLAMNPVLDRVHVPAAVVHALLVAAAGNHGVLLAHTAATSRKVQELLRVFLGLLPSLDPADALAVNVVRSLASGFQHLERRTVRPPFRAPHFTVEELRGRDGRPGEISLAHAGVLALVQAHDFRREVLQTVGDFLARGVERQVREGHVVEFPTRALPALTTTYCPCGKNTPFFNYLGFRDASYLNGDVHLTCTCTRANVERHRARLPAWAPLLAPVVVTVPDARHSAWSAERTPWKSPEEFSVDVALVRHVRSVRATRRTPWPWTNEATGLLHAAARKNEWDAARTEAVAAVATTCADLEFARGNKPRSVEKVESPAVAEALSLCAPLTPLVLV